MRAILFEHKVNLFLADSDRRMISVTRDRYQTTLISTRRFVRCYSNRYDCGDTYVGCCVYARAYVLPRIGQPFRSARARETFHGSGKIKKSSTMQSAGVWCNVAGGISVLL